MSKVDNFTDEELLEIINNSSGLIEFCKNIGYAGYSAPALAKIKQRSKILENKILELKEKRPFRGKDLTGQIFGRLTVIEYNQNLSKDRGKAYWTCQCNCENKTIINVIGNNLIRNHTTSCGCYQKTRIHDIRFKDLTSQHFGKLTVLELDQDLSKQRGCSYWKCKCECGNIKSIKGSHLTTHAISSCGCYSRSRGEEKIEKILQEMNILYKTQYTFYDLKGIGGGLLSYDFAILNPDNSINCLIEYQGIQHYDNNGHWGDNSYFKTQQEHDKRKRDYCIIHNIKLIEVPYYDKNNLNINYLQDLINN